jgi:glutathione synthase/RimK-type ligase-like ATP-grasp enzyme
MKVALAVCARTIDGFPDTPILRAALAAAGHEVRLLDWCDDPAWDWPDVALLHAPWDYAQKLSAFLSWLERVSARTILLNPAELVRANLHKAYLLDLQRAGIAIPQTRLLRKGSTPDPQQLRDDFGAHPVVIKPAVGSGGRRLERLDNVEALLSSSVFGPAAIVGEDVLVQRYEETIETRGEFSLVLVDGSPSHLVHKRPRQGEYRVQAAHGGVSVPVDIDDHARSMVTSLAPFLADAFYARIDYLIGAAGTPLLMELELAEPDLYLRYSPQAASRLAAGLSKRSSI